MTGNWTLIGESQVIGNPWLAGGYLTNTNGSVSGTIHMLNSSCYLLSQDIPVTGTVTTASITTAGTISLTSSSVSGQGISVKGTIAAGGSEEVLEGSYTIAGGCAAGDKGTVEGMTVPSYTNTYSGTFVSVSKISVPVSMTIAQTGPNSDGIYQATGSANFTGSNCFSTATISSSEILGDYMAITMATNSGGSVSFIGEVVDTNGTLAGNYQVTAGTCVGDYGTGTLSHP
jgi:hypothetical protein